MPWTGPYPNALSRWQAGMQANYFADYQAIYNFLTDEVLVRQWLRRMQTILDLHSFLSYRDSLHRIELGHGFVDEIVITQGALTPDQFRAHLFARKPIDDVAFVNARHGRATHRLQWAMIASWKAGTNPPPINLGVGELYKQLGGAMGESFGGGGFGFMAGPPPPPGQTPYLWDMLVDNETATIENATRPEYLYGQLIARDFPSLYIAMR